MGEKWPVKFSQKIRLPRNCWGFLHAAKLRHGTDGLTSPKKTHAEGFVARKIRRLRPGLNPRSWVPEASMLTTRPPKPLTEELGLTESGIKVSEDTDWNCSGQQQQDEEL
jgi:hypothetical protein